MEMDDDRIMDAIVKGIVEHDDSARYFGSLGAHQYYLREARRHGLIDGQKQVTPAGRNWYDSRQLGDLPERRWMFWPESRQAQD